MGSMATDMTNAENRALSDFSKILPPERNNLFHGPIDILQTIRNS